MLELVISLTEKLIVVFPTPQLLLSSVLACAAGLCQQTCPFLDLASQAQPPRSKGPVGNVLSWLRCKWSALLFLGRCPRGTRSEPVQPGGSLPLRALAELQLRQPAVQDLW